MKQQKKISLFLFLFALYLLTYAPEFHSSDGLAMFSTAESLARRGTWDIEQIRWMGLQQGTYGLDGLLYSRKGLGQPLLALPLTWLGLVIPWFGPATTTLLFGSLITALTAVLIFSYLLKLGYSEKVGLVAGLIYGVATMAWPYAKTFFSDTLAGTLLLITALALLSYFEFVKNQNDRRPAFASNHSTADRRFANVKVRFLSNGLYFLFIAGLSLGWAVATRYAEAVFLPVFGLLLLAYLWQREQQVKLNVSSKLSPPSIPPKGREALEVTPLEEFASLKERWAEWLSVFKNRLFKPDVYKAIFVFCLPIAVIGISLMLFNTSRYGNPLNTGYLAEETFSAVWWQGILGQLLSPGRGFLLYNPVLIITFFGLKSSWQHHRLETIASLSVILIHLLLYGKWFMWHGGYAWGARFMVATLPFWVILMAPVLNKLTDRRPLTADRRFFGLWVNSKKHGLIYSLVGLSILCQIPGVAVDFDLWQNKLLEINSELFAPITFFEIEYSPLLQSWQFINLANLDVAWVITERLIWGLLAIILLNLAINALLLRQLLFNLSNTKKQDNFALLPLAILITCLTTFSLLYHTHQNQAIDQKQALAKVNQLADWPLVYNDPEKAVTIAERYTGHARILGLWQLEADRLAAITESAPAVWWLPTHQSEIETHLQATHGLARNELIGEQRLMLFAKANGPAQSITTNFDDGIGLQTIQLSSSLQPNAPFAVTLTWQSNNTPNNNYHIFIHLLNENNELVAQTDGQPVHWTRPMSTWQADETITDHHALWIPSLAPGTYTLIGGLYNPNNNQRLLTQTNQDFVKLGEFNYN